MSEKVKESMSKHASSISFSFSRLYRRLSSIKPSTTVVAAIVIAFTIFICSGGLWTIINRPLPAVYSGTTFYFLYPLGLSGQFISDTVISAILYVLGFVGLLAIYQSTRSAYNPRQAYMLLAVGISLLIIVYIALEGAISFKLNFQS